MKLRYITCSDPREDIPVESLLNFTTKCPFSEIGVQAHPGPMSFGNGRNKWFGEIMKKAQNMPTPPNIAYLYKEERPFDSFKDELATLSFALFFNIFIKKPFI